MTPDFYRRDLRTIVWRAATIYFGAVFAVAFAVAMVRVPLVVPLVGALAAVALEVPLILGVSWVVAGWVLRRWPLDLWQRCVSWGWWRSGC